MLLEGLPSAEDVVLLTGTLQSLQTECSICFSEFNFENGRSEDPP